MPKIRTYHGNAGTQLHEITEEEYAAMTAEYSDLKARAERAADSPGEATEEDLGAAREAYELAYRLQRDEDMADLKGIMARCGDVLRERRIREDWERREATARESEIIRACESLAEIVTILANAPDPGEIPPATPREIIAPESLVDADLERAGIIPESDHQRLQDQNERLQVCLDTIRGGIPASARKRAGEYLEGLIKRNAEADTVNVVNIAAVTAERNRRAAERWQEEQARAEVENLPETVADLRERLAALEAKL